MDVTPRVALAVVLAASLGLAGASQQQTGPDTTGPAEDTFAFLEPTVTLSASDRRALAAGGTIVRTLPALPGEVAVFAALQTRADGGRLVAWTRDIVAFKESRYVLQIGRFSAPPVLEDLAALTLDEGDLNALADCRPGDCALKLTDAAMTGLRTVARSGGPGEHAALMQAFRRMLLDRLRTYQELGLDGLAPYVDRGEPGDPGQVFDAILDHTGLLTTHAPAFARYLRGYPHAPAPEGADSFFYWSNEQLHGRPSTSITHVAILQADRPALPEALVAGKQVFASHYTIGSLSLTAIVRGGQGERYLVYLNRSRVDVLDRWFGGLARRLIEGRLRDNVGEVLQGVRHRLESGEPP
jgi:hypothetical protein